MLGFVLQKEDNWLMALGMGAYLFIIGLGINYLNRRSAKKVVAPKLEKVNGLIQSLEA